MDHAKFVLHSCTVQEFKEKYGSQMGDYEGTTDGKVYETGTAQDAKGNTIPGVLLTDVQEAGLVYWFEEIEAPSGYEIIEKYRFVGPFVPEDSGIEGGTQYKLNQITSTDKVYNQELSGPGTDRFMQVELNKILINKDTKEFISNLSDVTFELWITDESGNRIELVDTMVTGKDMANAGEDPEEAKEVAGFACR